MSIAFLDVDGTLLARPSLERRFFRDLRRRGKIPATNYLRWIVETIRLVLRDVRRSAEGNKMYLRGISAEILPVRALDSRSTFPGRTLAAFFPAAIQRVWWHALRGDTIVLVSGTLAPLAEIAKSALERELLWRGIEVKVSVLATQLEIRDGRWTGRIAGARMFGEEKAAAIKQFARERGIALGQCSAYGDSALDRWMLLSVGHPFAINPTRRLRRVARLHGWPMLAWTHESLAKHWAVAKRGSITNRESERTAGGHGGLKAPLKWTACTRKGEAAR
jgi:HAD superfamily hydrolase (TIGR01490 family)